ncbi:MAG TPA: Minf_1886 family protein, partial [Verrucomicrobium sp.]|nr:Minf_1886 family protein [Verrucomicrobium sp.]
QFGPMAAFVIADWGLTCSEDVGNMVYNLIGVGYFGKNETDSVEDFSDGVALMEALNRPFRVARRP